MICLDCLVAADHFKILDKMFRFQVRERKKDRATDRKKEVSVGESTVIIRD